MYSAEEKIKWFAITSRVFVFVLQFVANYAIKDHDPGVFKKPRLPISQLFEDNILQMLTEGLTRWDAQYFLHIAEYGYTYENTLAFFPLMPVVLRVLAYPFQLVANNVFHMVSLPFFLTSHDALVLMSVVLNSVLFIHSAVLLHKLTLKITNNEKIAYASALLFCVNPASIFFSATYSETLFCFLTLNAMLYIESGHLIWGSMLVGLSAITRSNGLLNIGYIVYRIMKTRRSALSIIFAFIVLTSCLIVALLPFVAYQFYCHRLFCSELELNLPDLVLKHAKNEGYKLPGSFPSWCRDPLPFAYNYVQQHYWNVGFLKYFKVKQIPNFALAMPVLSFTVYGVVKFCRSHGWILIYLGFAPGSLTAPLPTLAFPYVLHNFALALFGFLCMHVQVSTRLIFSSCPSIYWFCAVVLVNKMSVSKEAKVAAKLSKKENAFFEPLANRKSRWKTIILSERFLGLSLFVRYYFFSYFMAGPAIFANNLPWT